MPDGSVVPHPDNPRGLPPDMASRLIVALDVPTIDQARRIVAALDGTVAFFKIGLWLAFAEGVDSLLRDLIQARKQVFLDTKMFDIGQTVEQGVARAADRGVSFVTVHGDGQIMQSAVKGKRGTDIKIFAVTVLTSLDNESLREMGYALTAQELVRLRVRQAVQYGCDGIIASGLDNPDEIRRQAGSDKLLIATPGIRPPDAAADDHRRVATPAQAIERGADYLVVGRPVVEATGGPKAAALRIIEQMQEGEKNRSAGA